jgi:hypothetical protein
VAGACGYVCRGPQLLVQRHASIIHPSDVSVSQSLIEIVLSRVLVNEQRVDTGAVASRKLDRPIVSLECHEACSFGDGAAVHTACCAVLCLAHGAAVERRMAVSLWGPAVSAFMHGAQWSPLAVDMQCMPGHSWPCAHCMLLRHACIQCTRCTWPCTHCMLQRHAHTSSASDARCR